MSKTALAFHSVDSWFFREPRPFHADESASGGVASLFPPHSRTVVGAARAALARSAGWSGRGRWTPDLVAVLGDGDDLGALDFVGPVVLRGHDPFYPVPRHVLVRETDTGWTPVTFLAPGAPIACDLGVARLPAAPSDLDLQGAVPARDLWCQESDLNEILAGRLPDSADFVHVSELVAEEQRIGIQRNGTTRTAVEHALYAARHIRPADRTAVALCVEGWPHAWPEDGTLVPFGGEGRAASLQALDLPDMVVTPDTRRSIERTRRYAATFLTPAFLPKASWQPGSALPDLLPGRVVAACVDEPIRIGGWNSLEHRPLPAHYAVPAGSTWFMELNAEDPESVLSLHGRHLAPLDSGRWLNGRLAIGAWRNDADSGGTE